MDYELNMKKKLLVLWMCSLLAPITSIAQGWDEAMYQQIEQSIRMPKFAEKAFPITKFGAKTNQTAAQNQKAIQKAIDACSKKGGGKVIIPAGEKFLTGAITLKDGVNLVVEEGATLEFVFQPELYPIVETSWEGLECFNLSPCIYAFKAKDIAITGKGTIDGGGSNDTWWPWNGNPRFGWKEGMISQRIESRPRLLKNGEDGIPMYNTGQFQQMRWHPVGRCDAASFSFLGHSSPPLYGYHCASCQNDQRRS